MWQEIMRQSKVTPERNPKSLKPAEQWGESAEMGI